VAQIAEQKKQSLILLPSHKSHVDYLVVSYVMFRLGLQIPHIVAGDNLDMPVIGTLLRGSGAFFIRREWGDDLLYKSIVEEYIATLLAGGYNLECFVEGTRSRLGKLLTPKFGILKIVLDTILAGKASDCMLVPISIGYDKIIETSNYANELLGTPKEKESLWGVFSSSRLLQLKWGRVDVRVSKPFSLKNWIEEQVGTREGFDVALPQNKVVLLKSLGYKYGKFGRVGS
jgi:glycerol-3-phosphate O-acyltransferase